MEGPGGNELAGAKLAGLELAGIELAGIELAGIELAGIELVRVSLPLRRSWVSGAGQFSHRDSLLVRAVLSVPVMVGGRQEFEGWGECGAFPGPPTLRSTPRLLSTFPVSTWYPHYSGPAPPVRWTSVLPWPWSKGTRWPRPHSRVPSSTPSCGAPGGPWPTSSPPSARGTVPRGRRWRQVSRWA